MNPPSLRVQREVTIAGDQTLLVWDLRIAQPNVTFLPSPVAHSLEHFLGVYLKEAANDVVNVAPMGCRTGFYIVTSGAMDAGRLASCLIQACRRICGSDSVPLADVINCGWAENHSLNGAQAVAEWLLLRATSWADTAGAA